MVQKKSTAVYVLLEEEKFSKKKRMEEVSQAAKCREICS